MADKDRASTYSVYDKGTYLCPTCDGYGWFMFGHSKMHCQRCDGIGNVGGDSLGTVSTSGKSDGSPKHRSTSCRLKKRAEADAG